jgi:hypothetical protein
MSKLWFFVYAWFLAAPVMAAEATPGECPMTSLRTGGAKHFDYYNPKDRQDYAPLVNRHFTYSVESLTKGVTGPLALEIESTVASIPNHPRALQSMIRLAIREKTDRPPPAKYSVTCHLNRGIHYFPNDLTLRMLKGQYLSLQGKPGDALDVLLEAEKLAPGEPNLAYNIGLLQLELKRYDKALEYAHIAYQAGFPLPGLREKLKRAERWSEPPLPKDTGSKPVPPLPDPGISASPAKSGPDAGSIPLPMSPSSGDATVPAKP